ncbi:uncharacterized protein LOC131939801 [Physella acuta]|uniref:uncharacterized protein LOC131939801 n=1 Tax=Physella acuta TaxID=109671 RepID=UPI0027DDFB9D|nr:uncharacterized protein LOC131939801 [Physella acuta]XP_059154291.1 uncharacterized protein LOC131939801 [Physella acuta]XP_059154292.1 uncharacterized protein LOC131939801 [Physella acuta]XP_059154294.1 uncharacterized protein LOC131939801 [Physella acuta]XP_059154295.1 uncharacterized protein LOC131939801 [Physella acuta]
MGNKQNKMQRKVDGQDNHDKEEASPFIMLKIVREYPSGTQEVDKEIRTGSNIQVKNFKNDLQKMLDIPAENLLIYRHNGKAKLPNVGTLSKLGLKDGDILRVRDGREKYQN